MENTLERLELLKNQHKNTSAIYKPVFYRLKDQDQLKEFSELLNVPGITVVDHILDQITEFVKLKSPEKRFSTEDLKEETKKYIGSINLLEYGVWVYYPWSRRMVHVLDKEEFIEVRTSRNQYKITREERDLLETKKVGIIGLSVGQSVSVTLAMERICGELRLADFDLLELTNLNRIRTGVHNLGLAKVYSVAREIAEIDPFLKVVCYPDGLNENNLDAFFTEGGKLDLLVEESDGFDIKILSRFKARELGVPVIMEASDRCMVDVERFDLEPDRSILHGIVKHLDVQTLKSLKTNEEKIPYMLDVLGLNSTTPRLRASMLEMQQTITTWPQLASAVTMGGGITADVSRRMLLNHFTDSGRYYVDIDQLIGNKPKEPSQQNPQTESHSEKESALLQLMTKFTEDHKFKALSEPTEQDLEKMVEAAISAPSYANQQPWKFVSSNGHLLLFSFIDKRDGILDVQGTNNLLSTGAAVENLILKSQELGYEANYELMPFGNQGDSVLVFNFKKPETKTSSNTSLSSFIFERHTNRSLGNGTKIAENILKDLSALYADEKLFSLSVVTEKDKIDGLANIAGSIERIRLLNPVSHADYFTNEIRWPGQKDQVIREGVDVNTLDLFPAALTAFEVVSDPSVAALLNQWNKGAVFEKLTRNSVASSSAIGLIKIHTQASPAEMVRAGQLMERTWLTATKNNLAFQPICVPLCFLNLLGNTNKNKILSEKTFSELKALNTQFSLIFNRTNDQNPVFLFRLFYSDKVVARSLRRTLDEVYFKS